MKEQRYAFVEDIEGNKLSPTKEEKAWYKVRKGKAKVVSKNPLKIQLLYRVENTDNSKLNIGLDVGQTTGVAVVQECKTRNKVIFKGNIEHRKDVSKLVTQRAGYRRLRRSEKRYRPSRFDNRGNSKKKGRIPPSIRARQEEILRVVRFLKKSLVIDRVVVEDVSFDIRCLTDGYKPYKWVYQKSNRLDENIRKATLLRDNHRCQSCGLSEVRLECHHITPRRLNGEDTLRNLITLCIGCHKEVTGKEEEYIDYFYNKIGGKQVGLRYASHVMQGKSYLEKDLKGLFTKVDKTTGGDTSNRRIEWGIEKSHSNDAVVIIGLKPEGVDVYEHTIKPLRKKRKCELDKVKSIVQGDRVLYTPRGKKPLECYVTAILKSGKMSGYYKLNTIKGNKRYGPVNIKSIKKIGTDKGLRII